MRIICWIWHLRIFNVLVARTKNSISQVGSFLFLNIFSAVTHQTGHSSRIIAQHQECLPRKIKVIVLNHESLKYEFYQLLLKSLTTLNFWKKKFYQSSYRMTWLRPPIFMWKEPVKVWKSPKLTVSILVRGYFQDSTKSMISFQLYSLK